MVREHFGQSPRVVVWSWEHKDDLRFIDPQRVAVAYYAGTIVLGRDLATLNPRRNPLSIPEKVVNFPVFRLENAHRDESPSATSYSSALDLIGRYLKKAPALEVQIDYDATLRDRKEYLRFLQQLRRRLPVGTAMSITALSSWCLDDKWLQAAPVDETVAMMFAMGRGRAETLSTLTHERLDSGRACRQSLGLSINEPDTMKDILRLVNIRDAGRIYAFSSLGWNKQNYEQFLAEVAKSEGRQE